MREREAAGSSDTESDRSEDELQEIFRARLVREQDTERHTEGNPHSGAEKTAYQLFYTDQDEIAAQNWAAADQSDGNEGSGDRGNYHSSEADGPNLLGEDSDGEPPLWKQPVEGVGAS